jgi:hypothetical protein
VDSGNACGPDGRLPDASLDQKHIRDVFYRMARRNPPSLRSEDWGNLWRSGGSCQCWARAPEQPR